MVDYGIIMVDYGKIMVDYEDKIEYKKLNLDAPVFHGGVQYDRTFKQIRFITITYDEYNNVWFKGKDVCDILKYKRNRDALKQHVENEDKIEYEKLNLKRAVKHRPYKFNKSLHPDTIYINESGLYCLVFSSKLPQAKFFFLILYFKF